MPRNGAGAYALPTGNPVVTGTAISSTVQNSTMSDIGTALTQSLSKDGQTTPSANLPMGSFRHTGVGNGVARTDYPSIGQVQDSSFMWCGTATGTANALLLVPTPIVPVIAAGQRFVFKSGANPNSGATTVSISTLPTIAVQVNGAACVGGEILADKWYEVIVDASTTSCQLNKIGPAVAQTLTSLGVSAFAQTYLDDADAAATRTTIVAAKSGANSDITSLTGLTSMSAFYASGGTTASSALAAVVGMAEVFDRNGDFNPTTGRFTAPVAGVYDFAASAQCGSAQGFGIACFFRVNGVATNYGTGRAATPLTVDLKGVTNANACAVINLAAGDYVEFWMQLTGTGFVNGAGEYFCGKRIL